MLEIPVVVKIVIETVHWICLLREIYRLVSSLCIVGMFSDCALLHLQHVFQLSCAYHIPIFQGSHVGPAAGVSGRDDASHLSWEIIQIYRVMSHPILPQVVFWHGVLIPKHLPFTLSCAVDRPHCYRLIPLP